MSWIVFGALFLIALIVNFAIGIMIVVGAVQMLRLRSYSWAMMATVLALIPCNPVSAIGIPIGIWSLVVLNRERVKLAFGPAPHPRANRPAAPLAVSRPIKTISLILIFVAALAWLGWTIGPHFWPGHSDSMSDSRLQSAALLDAAVGKIAAPAATELGLASWQTAAMDAVLAGYQREYGELEQKYTSRRASGISPEGGAGFVRATIYPFRQERGLLVDRYSRQLDAILERQQAAKFRQLMPAEGLFPWGEQRSTAVEIDFNGSEYRVQVLREGGSAEPEVSRYRELPLAYVRLWQPAEPPPGPKVTWLAGHTDWVYAVAVSPDGNYVVSAGADGRMIIRAIDRLTEPRIIGPRERKYMCLAMSHDSQFVLAGGTLDSGSTAACEKIALAGGQLERINLPGSTTITRLILCDDDQKVFCVEGDKQFHLVPLGQGPLWTVPLFPVGLPQPTPGHAVIWTALLADSPDTRQVALSTSATRQGGPEGRYNLSIIDTTGTRRVLASEDPVQYGRAALPAFMDSRALRLYLPDGNVRSWTYSEENQVWLEAAARRTSPLGSHGLQGWFVDGKTIWARLDHLLMGFDAETGRERLSVLLHYPQPEQQQTPFFTPITSLAPIPGANKVAVGMADGRVALVELESRL